MSSLNETNYGNNMNHNTTSTTTLQVSQHQTQKTGNKNKHTENALNNQAQLINQLKNSLNPNKTLESSPLKNENLFLPLPPVNLVDVPLKGAEKVRSGDKQNKDNFKTWSSKSGKRDEMGTIIHLKKKIVPRLSASLYDNPDLDLNLEEKTFNDSPSSPTSVGDLEEISLNSPKNSPSNSPLPVLVKTKRSRSLGESVRDFFSSKKSESPPSSTKSTDVVLTRMHSDSLVFTEHSLEEKKRPKLKRSNSISDFFRSKSPSSSPETKKEKPIKTLDTLSNRDRQGCMDILVKYFNLEGICQTSGLFLAETGGTEKIKEMTQALLYQDMEKFKDKNNVYATATLLKKFIASSTLFVDEDQNLVTALLTAGLNYYGYQEEDCIKGLKENVLEKMNHAKREILRQFIMILEKVCAGEKQKLESLFVQTLTKFFATALVPSLKLSQMSEMHNIDYIASALQCMIKERSKLLRGLDELSTAEQFTRMQSFLNYFKKTESCSPIGIFRVNGKAPVIEDISYAMSDPQFRNLDQTIDLIKKRHALKQNLSEDQIGFRYEMGDLLKRFVASCDLFDVKKSSAIYDAFIQMAVILQKLEKEASEVKIREAEIKKRKAIELFKDQVFSKMDPEKAKIFVQLLCIFKFILKQESINQMNHSNLARVFAPALSPKLESLDMSQMKTILDDASKNVESCKFLIENMDEIMTEVLK